MTQPREITERYRLERILRSTRFATVLRATDLPSGQTVVVKLIAAGAAGLIATGAARRAGIEPAFLAYTTALMAFRHPLLPAVLDSGFSSDGSAFLVLEYLEGQSFETLAGSPPARLLPLLVQAVDGLEALAARRLVHLNVAPENLLVVAAPAGEQLKLLGLGTPLFRAADSLEDTRFRAPEQRPAAVAAGERPDWRADLHSLALVACQALGVTVAFGDDPGVQMPFALSFELENAEALRRALERSLRRLPADRPSHAEVREAFLAALGAAEPPPWRDEPVAAPAAAPTRVPPAPEAAAPLVAAVPPASTPQAPAPQPAAVTPPPSQALSAPEPEPAAAGELLPSISDEVLAALMAEPAPPRPAAATGERAAPTPAAAPAPPAAGLAGLLRRPLVVGSAAAVLLLVAGAGYWLFGRQAKPAAAPRAAVAVAAKPPELPPAQRLAEAGLFLAQGDDDRARRVLRSFTPADQRALPPGGCDELRRLEQVLALATRDRLPGDLRAGLASGDLGLLRAAVAAGADQPEALDAPAARDDFARAHAAVDLYGRAEQAAARGDRAQALENLGALARQFPRLTDPLALREKAAAAVEGEAEKLVQDGRYAEALTRLAPLRASWPERAGLKERLAAYQQYDKDEQAQEALLAALPGVERRRKPYEGLESMRNVKPTPHLEARFAEARQRLEAQLAQLDQAPPQVALREGYYLEYARGTVAELGFRVTDDYQIKSVKLMARPQGGKMREVPLTKSGLGYTAQIPPSLHQNGTVEFYLTATDLSGHETSLGSPAKPLVLKRKEGFDRLIR
jgi:hypothetical protein